MRKTWPFPQPPHDPRDRDKMQIRGHDSFTCRALTSSKGKGRSSLPARCAGRGGYPSRSKITLPKVLFLIHAARELCNIDSTTGFLEDDGIPREARDNLDRRFLSHSISKHTERQYKQARNRKYLKERIVETTADPIFILYYYIIHVIRLFDSRVTRAMLEIKRNVFSILDFPEMIGRNKESELSHAALSIISLIFCSRKEETAICLAKLAADCTEKRTREREREAHLISFCFPKRVEAERASQGRAEKWQKFKRRNRARARAFFIGQSEAAPCALSNCIPDFVGAVCG